MHASLIDWILGKTAHQICSREEKYTVYSDLLMITVAEWLSRIDAHFGQGRQIASPNIQYLGFERNLRISPEDSLLKGLLVLTDWVQ